ncbi:SulP family inorganic anion transporter [Methylotenera sp.]|jgi:SulP family sulfate permease|uniref:SulP family inorganic anion transporter n=1 Tax=Methylotenera sp. TaxID=2051956 RepID=UPI002733F3F2|nr:SulP family inorganic anion transporter [Methylotenera sp.]MDP3777041.1 SulP family inorganic anion transporter [Methylotenera sp.]
MDLFKEFKNDFPASIVVFFVALPLCLGIALASGAPLFSGVIAGIVGGIVVGMFSGSQLGVSGPAAGLAVIVLTAIGTLGSFEAFLLSVMVAGVIQFLLGYFKAGFIAYFVPSSVIKGMLTGIGLLIVLKQIPHALGYDFDYEGSESFEQAGGGNTFSTLADAWNLLTPGALLIAAVSMVILILWDTTLTKKHRLFEILQGPIVVVLVGILFNYLFQTGVLNFSLAENQIVQLPVANNLGEFVGQFTSPDFSQITNIEIYKVGLVMAIVASLETLLCVEATDKLDPVKRITPTNKELKAQGIGNVLSGLVGGLPITQVIVRSSANITFGAKTKLSAILHGIWLLLSAVTIAGLLNMIPLASLAAILIMVGYKLAKPSLFSHMYKLGWEQFAPFIATVAAILLTDLLTGIAIGLVVGIFYTLHHSYRNSHYMKETKTTEDGREVHHIVLAEEVSFFNKASILQVLEAIPKNAKVIIDCSNCKSIAYDVVEFIRDYPLHAKLKNIEVETINFIQPKY